MRKVVKELNIVYYTMGLFSCGGSNQLQLV